MHILKRISPNHSICQFSVQISFKPAKYLILHHLKLTVLEHAHRTRQLPYLASWGKFFQSDPKRYLCSSLFFATCCRHCSLAMPIARFGELAGAPLSVPMPFPFLPPLDPVVLHRLCLHQLDVFKNDKCKHDIVFGWAILLNISTTCALPVDSSSLQAPLPTGSI